MVSIVDMQSGEFFETVFENRFFFLEGGGFTSGLRCDIGTEVSNTRSLKSAKVEARIFFAVPPYNLAPLP